MASTVALQAQLVDAARRYLQLHLGGVKTHLRDGSVRFVFSALEDDAELVNEVQRLCGALMRDVRNRSARGSDDDEEGEEDEDEDDSGATGKDSNAQLSIGHKSASKGTDLSSWQAHDAVAFADLITTSSGAALAPTGIDTLTRDVPQMCALLELLYGDVIADPAVHSDDRRTKKDSNGDGAGRRAGTDEVRVVVNFPPAMCASGSRVDVIVHGQVCLRAYSRTDARGNEDEDEDEEKGSSRSPSKPFDQGRYDDDSSDAEDGKATETTAVLASHAGQCHGQLWMNTAALAERLAPYARSTLERVLPAVWHEKSFALEDAGEALRAVEGALHRYVRRHSHIGHHSFSQATRRTQTNVRVLRAVVSSDIRQLITSQLTLQGGEMGVWRVKMSTLEAAVHVCRQWSRIVSGLMHKETSSSVAQAKGGTYSSRVRSSDGDGEVRDRALDRVAARLEDVWRARQLLQSMAALMERVPDTMLPEAIFASSGGIFCASASQWSSAQTRFNKELSFLEPALRQRVKQLLTRQMQVDGTRMVVRTLMPHRLLLALPGVRRAVEREMEQLSQLMVRQLDEVYQRYVQLSHQGSGGEDTYLTSSHNRVRQLALIRGVVVECVAAMQQARQLLGPSRQTLVGAIEVKARSCMDTVYEEALTRCEVWRLAMMQECRDVAGLSAAVTLDTLPRSRRDDDDDHRTGNAQNHDNAVDEEDDNDYEMAHVRCRVHPRVSALHRSALEFRRAVAVLLEIRHDTAARTADDPAGRAARRDERVTLSAAEEETIRACERVAAVAQRTQQCVAWFNTTGDEMLPCTRAMLRPLRDHALSQVFLSYHHGGEEEQQHDTGDRKKKKEEEEHDYESSTYRKRGSLSSMSSSSSSLSSGGSSVRTFAVANYAELDAVNVRFHRATVALCQQNRAILGFHDYLIAQVAALHEVDLIRHMDRWRSAVDSLRRSLDSFVTQHRLQHVTTWRRYWDGQLYKALELQYRRGLESLHETMEQFRVELVFRHGAVQFKPSLEAMREAYHVKMREFISVPLRFRGLQPKREEGEGRGQGEARRLSGTRTNSHTHGGAAMYEMYPWMTMANRDRIATVHGKAMEVFAKLARLRRAFRQYIAVGLCGMGGGGESAPSLDSIVDAWVNAEQTKHVDDTDEEDEVSRSRSSRRRAGEEDGSRDRRKSSGNGHGNEEDNRSRAQRYASGLRLVSERLAKMTAMEDTITLDCFVVSVIPVKASVMEQLHRLEGALIHSMRQGIQRTVKEMEDFVFVASNAVGRRPATLDEVGLANKALRDYRARMRAYERAFARIEAENAELRAHAMEAGTSTVTTTSASMSTANTTMVELAGLRSRWEHLREAMASHAKTMEGSVTKMRGSLESLIQRFMKEVQRFGNAWMKQKTALTQAFRSGNREHVRRLLPAIQESIRDVDDLTQQASDLQSKSDDLNQPRPSFGVLESTVRDIARMKTQWEQYKAFEEQLDVLRKEDWLTFRTHLYVFEDFCNEWREKLQQQQQQQQHAGREGGGGTKDKDDDDAQSSDKKAVGKAERQKRRTAAKEGSSGGARESSAVTDYLARVLQDWLQLIPLLRFIRGDGWMNEHWNEMFRLIELPKGTDSASLTFGDVLSHDAQVLQRRDELRALFLRAQGEIQLREALQDVRTWALDARFTLVTPSSSSPSSSATTAAAATKVKLITGWSDVLTQVSDNQALIASLRDSPFYSHFADEIGGWETNLATLTESLMLLNGLQRKWTYLEPIFARGALPHEQARFRRVDKEFVRTLRDIEADPRVMSLIAHGDFVDRAHTLMEQMDRCQRSLQDFLDAKRDKMPRFYFISDDDLLEIIGHSQTPSVIQTHLKKLFMGIHAVEWDAAASAMTHIRSADGERVALQTPVSITDSADVEDWLIRLDDVVRATLRASLVQCVTESSASPHGAAWTMAHSADGTDSATSRGGTAPPPPHHETSSMYPSQVLQVCQEILFARRVESALRGQRGLNALHQQLGDTLQHLTTHQDTAAGRRTRSDTLARKALILDLIHQRRVVELLQSESVTTVDSWWWYKQLRYYLDTQQQHDVRVRMTDAQFDYTYEYQGNAPKLVHTPLTDRCYIVLTQGMNFGYGGNPYGPAGTGKTESVKALGNALGRQVLVFNCGEGIDFQSMGRIFVGIVKCGAWGCFDEFNRLRVDQLSAVSQMIQGIQEALKSGEPTCALLGRDVEVNSSAGIFVTLNPAGKGYGGRSKLPDNLKQLFREVAMSVPDKELIVSTTLMAEGFRHGPELARGVVELYTLCAHVLSAQQHYDWGLRAMKAVLQLSGTLLQHRWRQQDAAAPRRSGDDESSRVPSLQTETELVVQALDMSTVSKLTAADAELFGGLLRDIFPRVKLDREGEGDSDLGAAVARAMQSLGLQPSSSQAHRVRQLHEALQQRMGVVLVGPSGCGKSTLIRILQRTLQDRGTRVPVHVINPKAMPRDQLLGRLDPDTREWFDGVLTRAAREVVKEAANNDKDNKDENKGMRGGTHTRPWIICDGDIDPEWVESLNSVLDDNKLLTMPNGVRIQFGDDVNFIFETHSLAFASPATVSRLGVIYCDESNGEQMRQAVESTLAALPEERRRILRQPMTQYLLSAMAMMFRSRNDDDEAEEGGGGEAEVDGSDARNSRGNNNNNNKVQRNNKHGSEADGEAKRHHHGREALVVPMISHMACLRTCLFHTIPSENQRDFVYSLARALQALLQPQAAAYIAQQVMQRTESEQIADMDRATALQTYWNRRTHQAAPYTDDLRLVDDGALQDEPHVAESATNTESKASSYPSPSTAFVFTSDAVLTRPLPLVRTAEVQRLLATMEPLVRAEYSLAHTSYHEHRTYATNTSSGAATQLPAIFVLGESGSGKCRIIEHAFAAFTPSGGSTARLVYIICSAHTRAAVVVQKIEELCSLYSTGHGRVYRPREAGRLVLVFKNVNLVRPDRYGTVELHAFLHQLITHGGFYSSELEWLGVERVQVVASMTVSVSPTSAPRVGADESAAAAESAALGYYPVSSRLMSSVYVVSVPTPSPATLVKVYTVYWQALLPLLQQRAQLHRRLDKSGGAQANEEESSSGSGSNEDSSRHHRNHSHRRRGGDETDEDGAVAGDMDRRDSSDVGLASSPTATTTGTGAVVRDYDGGRMLAQYMLAVYTKLRQRQSTASDGSNSNNNSSSSSDVTAMTLTPRLLTTWMIHTLMYDMTHTHARNGAAGGGLASVLAYEGCRLMSDGLPRASVRGRAAKMVYELLAMIGVEAGDASPAKAHHRGGSRASDVAAGVEEDDADDVTSSGYVSWAHMHRAHENGGGSSSSNNKPGEEEEKRNTSHEGAGSDSSGVDDGWNTDGGRTRAGQTTSADDASSDTHSSSLRAPLHHRSYAALYDDVVSARQRYGRTFRDLSLAVTAATVRWVARLDRALVCPRGGHAMLVGSPGVGRRDVVRLTAFMQRMEVVEPGATPGGGAAGSSAAPLRRSARRSGHGNSSRGGGGDYHNSNSNSNSTQWRQLWAELRAVVQRAVVQDERVLLLMSDHHMEDERAMDYINALVDVDGTSAVTTLFSHEEVEAMRASLRSQLSAAGAGASSSPTTTLLLARLRRNLHVVVIMDSENVHFGARLRANPSLLRGCALLWMGMWQTAEMRQQCRARLQALANGPASSLLSSSSSSSSSSSVLSGLLSQSSAADTPVRHAWGRFHSLDEAMVYIHHSYARHHQHKRCTGSNTYLVTPSQLTLLTTSFVTLLTQQQHRRAEREHRLSDGLSALDAAEAEVRTTAQTVTKQQSHLATLQQASQVALTEIQSNMQQTQEQRRAVERLERQLAAEDADMTQQRARVEEELSTIQPLLDSAREAVRGIRTEQLHEIRSFKSPPEPIRDVLEGVLGLLGMRDVSWSAMRSFLGERGVTERIVDFDVHRVTPAMRQSVARLVQQKQLSFTEEVIYRASVAAAPMARWVHAILTYAERLEQTAPLHDRLAALADSQARGARQIESRRAEMTQLAESVAALRDDFAARCREAERVKTELTRAEAQMQAATDLLHKLAGEKERWVRDVAQMTRARARMPRRALLAAALMTYLTAEGEESRGRWRREWGAALGLIASSASTSEERGCRDQSHDDEGDGHVHRALNRNEDKNNHTTNMGRNDKTESVQGEQEELHDESAEEAVSFTRFMRREADLLQFRSDGLPDDELSRENAIVVLDTVHTPLLVDPAQQAVTWLLQQQHPHQQTHAHEPAQTDRPTRIDAAATHVTSGDVSTRTQRRAGMEVVALHDPRLAHTLELAIRFGKVLLIRDVDHIPALLFPVLRREFVAAGAKRVVQVGTKSVDWQDGFRLLLVTRRAHLPLPPSAAALVTRVNFAVTACGLTSQLLGLTIRHERSAWEGRRVELLRREDALRREVGELEEELLRELGQARSAGGGHMLSNAPLMRSLDEVQQRAAEAQRALAQSRALQAAMDRKRDMYRPLAQRGSLLFAVMGDLSRLNNMYQFGLAGFMELFVEVLTRAGGAAAGEGTTCPDQCSAASVGHGNNNNSNNEKEKEEEADTADEEDAATHERVRALVQQLTQTCLRTTAAALFRRDQPLFALHLLSRLHPEHFDPTLWDLFVGTAVIQRHDTSRHDAEDAAAKEAEEESSRSRQRPIVSPPAWAPASAQAAFRALLARAPPSFLTRVQTRWKLDRGDWQRWMRLPQPESHEPLAALGLDSLGAMDRLLLIATFRPDRLLAAMQSLLRQHLQRDEALCYRPSAMTFTLHDALRQRSSARRPLLLLTGPGADPSVAMEDMAARQFSAAAHSPLVQVALGGGQTEVAMQELHRAVSEGHWLMLKNVHLVLDWAVVLEREWATLADSSPSAIHPSFRLILTTEAEEGFPVELLRRCAVVTVELGGEGYDSGEDDDDDEEEEEKSAEEETTRRRGVANGRRRAGAAGVRATVRRVYERWGWTEGAEEDDDVDEAKAAAETTTTTKGDARASSRRSETSRNETTMRRSLAWLHAVAVGRRDYVPQGWLMRYEFTDADVKLAWAVVSALQTRWRSEGQRRLDHVTLHGVLADGVYGGRLGFARDEAVLRGLLRRLLCPAPPAFVMRSSCPTSDTQDVTWVAAHDDTLTVLALPANAHGAVQEAMAREAQSGLRRLSTRPWQQEQQHEEEEDGTSSSHNNHAAAQHSAARHPAAVIRLLREGAARLVAPPWPPAPDSSDAHDPPLHRFAVAEVRRLRRAVAAVRATARAGEGMDWLALMSGRVPRRWDAALYDHRLGEAGGGEDGGRGEGGGGESSASREECWDWLRRLRRWCDAAAATPRLTALLRAAEEESNNASASSSSSTMLQLMDLVRPHAFLAALRQHTARQSRVAVLELVLTAVLTGTAEERAARQSGALRTGQTVLLSGSSIGLQGAVLQPDGCLRAPQADTPSTVALSRPIRLGWGLAGKEGERREMRVPLYTAADRTTLLFELTVGCASAAGEEELVLHGVACYLMPDE